jgi:hypothetical protein
MASVVTILARWHGVRGGSDAAESPFARVIWPGMPAGLPQRLDAPSRAFFKALP